MPRPVPDRPLRIAVLDDYLGVARDLADWERLQPAQISNFTEPLGGVDRVAAALEAYDVICAMRERTPIPGELLHRLPNLALIVTTGMQNASIDIAAAHDLGIVVSGTDSSASATVELTWALILAAARRIAANDRDMRAGHWQRRLGTGLAGKRLGIIGLGRNGSRVAAVGAAFGMDVVAWSQNLDAERATSAGARLVTRDELLATSDVVSIHLRLSSRTRALIGSAELGTMKRSAILVNTSRGPIVDEAALIDALRSQRIAGAALDVYDDEPLPSQHPLRTLDSVVLSPHVGYVTEENMRRFYAQTVEDIEAWRAGRPVRTL